MKAPFFLISIVLVLFSFTNSGCGSAKSMSLNSIEKTSQLRPGMTYDQVVELLGKPKSSQMIDDKWVVRWSLQEMWVGYKPYDMIFDPANQTLISWSENEAAFKQNQENLKQITEVVSEATKESARSGGNSEAGGGASVTGPTDEALMKYFAGKYYSFSASGGGTTGGSEQIIHLCGDGRFHDSYESGYSGGGWGTANQSGGSGSWRINGSKTEGTIVTVSPSGKARSLNYSVCGDGCLYIGGTKFAYAGEADCR